MLQYTKHPVFSSKPFKPSNNNLHLNFIKINENSFCVLTLFEKQIFSGFILFQKIMDEKEDTSIHQLISEILKEPDNSWKKKTLKLFIPFWFVVMFFLLWILLGKLDNDVA